MQKNILLTLLLIFLFSHNQANCEVITGSVNQDELNLKNKVIDYKTKEPLANAKITIPELNYSTYSSQEGLFKLNVDINNKTILFVEKEGYKVFSLTIDNNVLKHPLKLGIEKYNPSDFQISDGIIHLGDNMFSDNSANSTDFKLSANGYYFTKTFNTPISTNKQDVILKIGTIIGLDTKKAKQQGQNKINKVYSSPMRVFVNDMQISTIELNGDNFEIVIPKHVLSNQNTLRIETGINLFQTDYRDYDDVELANIRIELKEKRFLGKK